MRMNRVEYLHLCAHMGGMGKTFSLDYFVRYTVTAEHTKIKYSSMVSYVCGCVCVWCCVCGNVYVKGVVIGALSAFKYVYVCVRALCECMCVCVYVCVRVC